MAKFNRRRFLVLSAAGVGTAVAAKWIMGKDRKPILRSPVNSPRLIHSQVWV